MSSPDDLVIVHQAATPSEAEIVLTLLKGSGIAAVIPDSYTPFPGVDLTPYSSPGGAACDVYVPAKELERAREVLRQARNSSAGEDKDE
jgi:hypothetical protein